MSERDPSMNIGINGEDFELNKRNTMLYRHIARYAIYDHVYITLQKEPPLGAYIFRESENFDRLENWLDENEFPVSDHIQEPSEHDASVYLSTVDRTVPDTIPEGWQ